ncbi:MAG: response regulator [Gemmatimonadetes bacterium]|nr:response regulator [Gemmatimonadota bacterium]MBK7783991.1 response regulator [Gemmatimonadota bacterium]
MRILIAEDDTTSRLVLERTLKKLGYGVLAARDGAEAWQLYEQERPPVVITDWMMPRLDGLDLCRRVRSDARDDRYTWLVVLTALGGKQNYLEAMNAGADDFLTKPFDPDELVTRLRVAERILGMESKLAYLEAMHHCCPGCARVRQDNGRWVDLRQVAAEVRRRNPRVQCPECRRRDARPARVSEAVEQG